MARPTYLGMGQRLLVDVAQAVNRGIGIRGGLKVGQKTGHAWIPPAELPDAVIDLLRD